MELLALGLPVAFYFLNRIRGQHGWGGPMIGAAFGAAVGIFTLDPVAAAVAAVLFAVGEAMGWGRWLALVPHWFDGTKQADYMANERQPDRGKFLHKIADKIAPEAKDFRKYSQVALVLRGLYWWLPVCVALAALGAANPLVALVVPAVGAVAFPAAYAVGYQRKGKKGYWSEGERIYGAIIGALLAALIIL